MLVKFGHQSHAASAFFPSPFEEAVVLTMDGVGEWATTSVAIGRGSTLETVREIHWPHSLGLLYSAFTYYTGFRVNSGEYKVMGLAPYGEPRFKDLILAHVMDLKADGSFWLDPAYFNYATGLTMTTRKFHDLFGGPPRDPDQRLDQRHMDLAASIQAVTEEVMLRMTRDLRRKYNIENLLRRTGLFGILSVGVAFVIITAGIDLSIGSVVCLVGVGIPLLLTVFHVPLAMALATAASRPR